MRLQPAVTAYSLLRPLIFGLDAERAHRLTIAALKLLPAGRPPAPDPLLESHVAGLHFPNPVGLAAGFDKDAEVWRQMLGIGFGFTEVGTVTPLPQAGNRKPRLFRLVEDCAVINRMGFNNGGLQAAVSRLTRRHTGIVGVNVGANKDSTDRIADYASGVGAVTQLADYITINISSPNTPGLRDLQERPALDDLLAAALEARGGTGPPIFLKVAPDLETKQVDAIAAAAIDGGADALIVSNTTVTRPPLRSRFRDEAGGLSGAPLKALALDKLRAFRSATGGALPLIGAGGIASGADALERIKAGASLVQIYSALVYEGPGLPQRVTRELAALLRRDGYASLAEAVGSEAR